MAAANPPGCGRHVFSSGTERKVSSTTCTGAQGMYRSGATWGTQDDGCLPVTSDTSPLVGVLPSVYNA